jgi:hypothetical protein
MSTSTSGGGGFALAAKHVTVKGLTSATGAALNGRSGFCQSFDPTTGRFTVMFKPRAATTTTDAEPSQTVALKPANLEVQEREMNDEELIARTLSIKVGLYKLNADDP